MCASSAVATRHPSEISSSRTSVSAAGVFDVTRIDTNEGSSLVRPILNSSTSNAASWRTTVSNIAFISWESIRWPSASTTSVTVRATASSPSAGYVFGASVAWLGRSTSSLSGDGDQCVIAYSVMLTPTA
jgi:hypothetical protein